MTKGTGFKHNGGLSFPAIGFGTWHLDDGHEAETAVLDALKAGYRLIDTAKLYGNEASVGRAVNSSGIDRGEIFISTKLWNTDHGYDNALKAFDESLARLNLEYVDLYLIHWPASEKLSETWRALMEINSQGRARAIGVSNYSVLHLQDLLGYSDVLPAVNQLEFHPFVYELQRPIVEFCQRHNIEVMAYSPLHRGSSMQHPDIMRIAKKLSKTPAQVMLRWAIQHGTVPIPKSAHAGHIRENFDVFDFELNEGDMAALDSLG